MPYLRMPVGGVLGRPATASRGSRYTHLTESARAPFHAEPTQYRSVDRNIRGAMRYLFRYLFELRDRYFRGRLSEFDHEMEGASLKLVNQLTLQPWPLSAGKSQ